MSLSYIVSSVLISGGVKLEIPIIGWHQTFCFVHDIYSAYRKLLSVMCSLFLASVVSYFQTIINFFFGKKLL